MKHNTTLQDIAKALKLTPATVSRALNNHPEISEKTKILVKETANRLNYNRNKIASSLRSGKTNVLGVLIPSAEHAFFGSIIHGITKTANENGYDVIIYQSNERYDSEINGINAFMSARVDGILASLSKSTTDYAHILSAWQHDIPVVLFDRIGSGLDLPSVSVNDNEGAYVATRHLIHQGFKRIAHIAGPQNISAYSDRLQGYKRALQAHGISFDASLVGGGQISAEEGRASTNSYIEHGRTTLETFMQLPAPPDAVFAVDDLAALGALKWLKQQGYRVPADFGVIGFCNDIIGEHTSPTLSSVDQQTIRMGQEAFNMIYQYIRHKDAVNFSAPKVVLDPIPIFRESSCRKPEAEPL